MDTKSLPGSIRVDFVKKVYGLLFYMLAPGRKQALHAGLLSS